MKSHFNLSTQSYSLDNIVDQPITVNSDVQTYKAANPASALAKAYPSGASIGVCDSYIINQFGTWLMFYDNEMNAYYYYLVRQGQVNTEFLKQQGVLTQQEETDKKAADNMSFMDKLKGEILSASKIFLIALAIIVLLFIVYQIYVHTKK